MVVVGGALMVSLNGMSAGQSAFMNKQMSMLAPNVLFVSSGQMNFRGLRVRQPFCYLVTKLLTE